MIGFGQRLRERARELGLADATVAERLGLSQQRYHNYVSDQTEPDFGTLLRICQALDVEPNVVLGFTGSAIQEDECAALRSRISAAVTAMEMPILRITAAVVDTMAKQASPVSSSPAGEKSVTRVKRSRKPVRQHIGG